jgi:hypothetical protein
MKGDGWLSLLVFEQLGDGKTLIQEWGKTENLNFG